MGETLWKLLFVPVNVVTVVSVMHIFLLFDEIIIFGVSVLWVYISLLGSWVSRLQLGTLCSLHSGSCYCSGCFNDDTLYVVDFVF